MGDFDDFKKEQKRAIYDRIVYSILNVIFYILEKAIFIIPFIIIVYSCDVAISTDDNNVKIVMSSKEKKCMDNALRNENEIYQFVKNSKVYKHIVNNKKSKTYTIIRNNKNYYLTLKDNKTYTIDPFNKSISGYGAIYYDSLYNYLNK